MSAKQQAYRKKLIQLIHIGGGKLFQDADERKDWQQAQTGHRSCRDMSVDDLKVLADTLRDGGYLRGDYQARRAYSPSDRKPVQAKITAMWIEMAKDGLIRDGSEKALGLWCHRMTGRYSIDWLGDRQASQLLEALKKWEARLEAAAKPEPPAGQTTVRPEHSGSSASLRPPSTVRPEHNGDPHD